jgi:hypothetical protein
MLKIKWHRNSHPLYTVPVKSLYFVHRLISAYILFCNFLHCRIIVKTSELWNNTWNHVVTQKKAATAHTAVQTYMSPPLQCQLTRIIAGQIFTFTFKSFSRRSYPERLISRWVIVSKTDANTEGVSFHVCVYIRHTHPLCFEWDTSTNSRVFIFTVSYIVD